MRFGVTMGGVGVSVALMLFLAGAYGGVSTEANGYVAQRPVTVWVAQRNSTNLVRSTSFLGGATTDAVRTAAGVADVTPLLRLITTLTIRRKGFTAFVCGIDSANAATRPMIVEGTGALGHGNIVVDRALARRTGLTVGDTLSIQGRTFRVSGISSGTNVVISQFTFIALDDAQKLLGFPNVVSFLLVQAKPGVTPATLAVTLRDEQPDLNVFTAEQFVANNLEELQTGLLPILATVALFGAIIGASVVTLLLYGAILDRREDYAVVKAIGAGAGYVRLLVLGQSIASVACGYVVGLALYFASAPLIVRIVPVFISALSLEDAARIALATLVMGAVGALVPILRLQRIHPAEAFRA
jgi:putative ABC transport system permease protein